jgi:lipopolysaccharide/colanic/teichoic acid biosynthesis glycosyltransferase
MKRDKLLIDPADRGRSGAAAWTLRRLHDVTRDTPGRGSVAADRRSPTTAAESVLAFGSSRQASPDARPDEVLPKHYFLSQLEREKRRTDRSKASLSIVLFRFDSTRRDPSDDVDRLLGMLCRRKRETDVVGYLSDDQVAVLLPDTDAQGTVVVARTVIAHTGELGFSTVSATYPDRVFEDLKAENQASRSVNPLFAEDLAGANAPSYPLKRSLDIVGAIGGLLLLSPLMLIIAAVVTATSPGPAIFKQVRLGRRGEPFTFYKFRSMYCEADDQIHREYVGKLIAGDLEGINNGEATKPLYKLKDDPRITWAGRLLRKTSMDELPQLFNVLKGDMSLVGPRPPLPYEAERYQSWHLRRVLEIKPGITGLWQVNGRSKTSFDEMVRLDLQYVRTCSLWLDLKILLRTVKVVLRGDGAN